MTDKPADMIASDLIFKLRDSYDMLDTVAKFNGTMSIEYKEAFDAHFEIFNELKRLLIIGLENDIK